MSDTNNKCPLCGKDRQEGETFCSDCRKIAENAYPQELLSHIEENGYIPDEENVVNLAETEIQEASEENGEFGKEEITEENKAGNPPTRSNKKSIIFLLIGAVLLVLIGGIGSYTLSKIRKGEETEIAYWNKCIEENTPLSYAKYLVRYPEGKYSTEAHDKIMELRNNERDEWQSLRSSKNIDALFSFLTDHPETPYTREIRQAIDSLSWAAALSQNTVNGYQAYIDNVKIGRYPGEYVDLAEQKFEYLSQLKVVEGVELNEVKSVLSDFFKALSSTDSKSIQAKTTPTLIRFYNATNVANTALADIIKADIKKNNLRSVSYTPDLNSPEVIKDNKGIYKITGLILKKEKTFTSKKKKKESSEYNLNVELNDMRFIQAVYEKEK